MNDFWNNISRYPRFFISSVTGLIIIILNPFKNLFKIPKFRLLSLFGIISFLGILIFIIKSMVAL